MAAVCFRDPADRILTVRKRGTSAFMLPGGKVEHEESPESAVLREVFEELGVELTLDDLTHSISEIRRHAAPFDHSWRRVAIAPLHR